MEHPTSVHNCFLSEKTNQDCRMEHSQGTVGIVSEPEMERHKRTTAVVLVERRTCERLAAKGKHILHAACMGLPQRNPCELLPGWLVGGWSSCSAEELRRCWNKDPYFFATRTQWKPVCFFSWSPISTCRIFSDHPRVPCFLRYWTEKKSVSIRILYVGWITWMYINW